jgi:stage III sporulation protein AD
LAVCYLTQLATDACKDAGETAIAGKLELAGKIAIVILSLPLFNSLVNLITGLIT